MLVMWCLAWMTAFVDPMGLNAMRHDAHLDRLALMERGPANASLDRLKAAIAKA
jgi:hypothetical protein